MPSKPTAPKVPQANRGGDPPKGRPANAANPGVSPSPSASARAFEATSAAHAKRDEARSAQPPAYGQAPTPPRATPGVSPSPNANAQARAAYGGQQAYAPAQPTQPRPGPNVNANEQARAAYAAQLAQQRPVQPPGWPGQGINQGINQGLALALARLRAMQQPVQRPGRFAQFAQQLQHPFGFSAPAMPWDRPLE